MSSTPLPWGRAEIEACIPHRAPFLWLDVITELTETRVIARKRLDPELDVFAGHYPHRPVFPGVLLCEAAFQAGAVLISQIEQVDDERVPVVTRLNLAKFRRMVKPGETLVIDVELTERLANAYFLTGKVSVDGQTAVRLEFACAAVAAE